MAHLPAVGIIKVAVIIEVAAIIKVAATEWMTISLNTVLSRATPILDATEVILDKDPVSEVLLTLIHPDDILTGLALCPDPADGTNLILAVRPSLGLDLTEDMVVALGVVTVQDP